MKTVKDYLDQCSKDYYEGSPTISDEQFDRLATSCDYHSVGAKQHGNLAKHYQQMYSLQKHYVAKGKEAPLQDFKNKSMSPKLDGAAISLLYVDHKLVQVLTRGDGIEGRIITDKFLATNLVPHTIPKYMPSVCQVTGEVCAPKHIENARNYAAGALNLGSADEFRTRALDFFSYDVFPTVGTTYDETILALRKSGFKTVQDSDLDKIYPTDGIVFRVQSNYDYETLGWTSKHPRGAYALKEQQAAVETILLRVEWQVGKTGRVTPVAVLEPVLVGDAVVTRATLNNPGFIKALDLRIGDVVQIIRSGEIIPCIIGKSAA